MSYKRIYSKEAIDGGIQVSYSVGEDVRIESFTGAIDLTPEELVNVLQQADELLEDGTIILMNETLSSNIEFVGYSKRSKILRVRFKSNSYYDYEDVPEEEYDALIAAESMGHHFYKNIRSRFTYKKMEQEEKDIEVE